MQEVAFTTGGRFVDNDNLGGHARLEPPYLIRFRRCPGLHCMYGTSVECRALAPSSYHFQSFPVNFHVGSFVGR